MAGSGGIYPGGCLCGAVRFRATGPWESPHWCHCETCRKATGAPAAAFVNFPVEGFEWEQGEPAWYESSPGIERGFCSVCGTSLCTFEPGDALISLLIGCLDEPERIAPTYQIWMRRRLSWLDDLNDLPGRP
ncbi:GFA family protein [Henriciella aquimarina]|uniref:GFA family protein n=1 Tax=Henriciella aquimarina TaxID=545261 RepID=UPI000A06512A|nr:GFA family protein [Henriciella aquimarina]